MILSGLKFGMLLQLVVGPMCLLVFNTSSKEGIIPGLVVMASITLVDAIYITLAGFGMAAFLKKDSVRKALLLFGGLVLIAFGADAIAGAFGYSLLPKIALFKESSAGGNFMRGFLLTASNPLTIIFWGGVFSSQVAKERLSGAQLVYFGIGCALSTALSLGLVAVLGGFMKGFLPDGVIKALSVIVGCVMIYMGVTLPLKKQGNVAKA